MKENGTRKSTKLQKYKITRKRLEKEVLGVQKSSVLFFVKFNLYSKTNKKILISEIFSVCINDLLPSFG